MTLLFRCLEVSRVGLITPCGHMNWVAPSKYSIVLIWSVSEHLSDSHHMLGAIWVIQSASLAILRPASQITISWWTSILLIFNSRIVHWTNGLFSLRLPIPYDKALYKVGLIKTIYGDHRKYSLKKLKLMQIITL